MPSVVFFDRGVSSFYIVITDVKERFISLI